MRVNQASDRAFFGASTLLFAVSVWMTVAGCASMSAMGEMHMPGGWTMSMVWIRRAGQTWSGAATSFLSMWVTMMVAMMLPSVAPILRGYRDSLVQSASSRANLFTALASAGYFFLWLTLGIVVFALGSGTAAMFVVQPTLARIAPLAAGAVVLVAGLWQFSGPKAHYLACCRQMPARSDACDNDAGAVWQIGVRLGVECVRCCANLMVIFIVVGVVNISVMAVVGTAIAVERLAPSGERAARVVGAVAIGAGFFLMARASVLA